MLAEPPVDDFTDRNEQRHRVWAIRDPRAPGRASTQALADSQALIADGHHRYAAYLRMQRRSPAARPTAAWRCSSTRTTPRSSSAPIHRILTGVSLDDLAAAAEVVGASLEVVDRPSAVHALGPATLAVTDGRRLGHRSSCGCPRTGLPSRCCTTTWSRRCRAARSGSSTTTRSRTHPATALRKDSVAVLMPAPDFDLVLKIAADDRLLPEKATSFQPKPSVGVLIRSLRDE